MGAEATTGSAAGSVKTAITVTAAPADRAGRGTVERGRALPRGR